MDHITSQFLRTGAVLIHTNSLPQLLEDLWDRDFLAVPRVDYLNGDFPSYGSGLVLVRCAEIITSRKKLRDQRNDITWAKLSALNLPLCPLREEAAAVKDDGQTPSFCGTAIWHGYDNPSRYGLIHKVSELVGRWSNPAADPILHDLAYDFACAVVRGTIPNCRNCNWHNRWPRARRLRGMR